MLNVGAFHEAEHVQCRCTNFMGMGFLLSWNASNAHVAISNGFHLEHFVLGQDPVKAAEEGVQRVQKLPGSESSTMEVNPTKSAKRMLTAE